MTALRFFLPLFLICATLLGGCASRPAVSPLPARYDTAPGAEARTFRTADKLVLFGQWWTPAAPATPRAVVLLVHGTLVHSGFYAPWAEHLVTEGYAVFGIDLRGWGQSQGYGRRGFIENYDEYVEDLTLAYQEVKKRYPDLPLFLQGESMGGTVVMLSQIDNALPADGMVLNAPAIRPAPGLWGMNAPNLAARVGFEALSVPAGLFPNGPLLLSGTVINHTMSLVLRDPAGQERFRRDPHSLHASLPLAYFRRLYEGGLKVQKHLGKIDTPLIIVQGNRDVLVPPGSSEYVMTHIASADKTLKLHDGMTHATLHDIDRDKAWTDITTWLETRMQRMERRRQMRDGS